MEKKPQLRVLNESKSSPPGMNRREMVQRFLSGVGAGVAGMALPGVAAAHPVSKHLSNSGLLAQADAKAAAPGWAPEFLDAHQNETLIVLAERIVPGSTRAAVNRFIDLLLTVDTADNQRNFLNSLSSFDAESLKRFGHPFKAITEAQETELLTFASTAERGQPQEKGEWSWFAVPSKQASGEVQPTLRDHFENLKAWVSAAYYSSEVGMRELGWTGDVYFDSFPGCQHPEGHR